MEEIVKEPSSVPSTMAGMTAKVVKGSIWTLAGQIAPLGASLVATPFVIRQLGSESYGVLILVGIIPTYFGFADFGMSIASTKFGSEAYAANDPESEARVVRTAAVIASFSSLPFTIAFILCSGWIVTFFNVPTAVQREAAIALKLAAITFFVNFLNGIFNTPQLSRLRMDLNTFVTSGFRIIGIIATPFVIYIGGGVLGAVAVLMIGSLLTLFGHLYVSGRLLPPLLETSIDRGIVPLLMKFGGGLAMAAIATLLLVNVEKVMLSRMVSVGALAYYSVAFTFASMATMLSNALIQSLVPAFSQLLTPERRSEFELLSIRAIRINAIILLPALTFLLVVAKPFFTLWAGREFGQESTPAFYILLVGLLFNLMAYVPYCAIVSYGRSDVLVKLYWIQLGLYFVAVWLLINRFGIIGAALAWSLRVIFDAVILAYIAKTTVGISFGSMGEFGRIFGAFVLILPAVVMTLSMPTQYEILFPVVAVSLMVYFVYVWRKVIQENEKAWVLSYFGNCVNFVSKFGMKR